MKLLLLLSFFPLSPSWAETWKSGDFEIALTRDQNNDWSSQDCLKKCAIDHVTKKILKANPLRGDELSGGKNPGSVICGKINGKVIYLKNGDVSQAFCSLNGSVVSLGRLRQ